LSRTIAALLLMALAGAGILYAQLEGGDRGIPPVDSTSTYEVTGIKVDVVAKNASEARIEGWRQAQARGWRALWANTNKRPASEAPNLPDSALNGLVSAIEVEQEEIGPNRYIATLGVLFDRARTGPLLGGGSTGEVRRSAPMLVIPVMMIGSSSYSFEFRNEWQRAWARFRTGNSAIDYVRPVGNGIDPLLLNASQTHRPGRHWWRVLLDQYGASDVLSPEVKLKRTYPGGPIVATFNARHGPDNSLIGSFTLRVQRSDLLPQLLDVGVKRIDALYTAALQEGRLSRDRSLTAEAPVIPPEIAAQIEAATDLLNDTKVTTDTPAPVGVSQTYELRVETPDSASVGQAELSVSRIRGVTSAITTSLALGGTSVMRVTFMGDTATLQAALQANGLSGTIRVSRALPRN
jgi:hypothetical protein